MNEEKKTWNSYAVNDSTIEGFRSIDQDNEVYIVKNSEKEIFETIEQSLSKPKEGDTLTLAKYKTENFTLVVNADGSFNDPHAEWILWEAYEVWTQDPRDIVDDLEGEPATIETQVLRDGFEITYVYANSAWIEKK